MFSNKKGVIEHHIFYIEHSREKPKRLILLEKGVVKRTANTSSI